jgi:hypothetical protein
MESVKAGSANHARRLNKFELQLVLEERSRRTPCSHTFNFFFLWRPIYAARSLREVRSVIMPPSDEDMDNSQYWTKERRELAQWLHDRAPSFEHGYMGAVRLLHMPSFPGRVHFVCHAVRDIYRRLPAALGADAVPIWSEVVPKKVKSLCKEWNKCAPGQQRADVTNSIGYVVDPRIYRCVEDIVSAQKNIVDQPSVGKSLAIALFRAAEKPPEEFISPWLIRSFDREYDFFVARAHLAKSMNKAVSDKGLAEHFKAFERAFHSMVGSYFTGQDELDEILQDTNTRAN